MGNTVHIGNNNYINPEHVHGFRLEEYPVSENDFAFRWAFFLQRATLYSQNFSTEAEAEEWLGYNMCIITEGQWKRENEKRRNEKFGS